MFVVVGDKFDNSIFSLPYFAHIVTVADVCWISSSTMVEITILRYIIETEDGVEVRQHC